MFFSEYCKIFKNTYFEAHLLTAAFDFLKQLCVATSVVTHDLLTGSEQLSY